MSLLKTNQITKTIGLMAFAAAYAVGAGQTAMAAKQSTGQYSQKDGAAEDDGKDKKWSFEEMKKRREAKRSSFFYVGVGFSVGGMGFEVETSQAGGKSAVLSNGLMSNAPLLGDIVRLGYEYTKNGFYLGLELYGSSMFSVASGGEIGSLASGEGISITSFGKGTVAAGFNVKPGFSFNNNKGAMYAIIGTGYQWLKGDYTSPTGTAGGFSTIHFDMSGFGLNYGIGLKYTIHSFVMIFFDFLAVAPIKGSGALGLDRTAFEVGTDQVIQGIKTYETYTINLGLDFRV